MNCIVKMIKGYFISFTIFLLLTVLIAISIKATTITEQGAFYYLLGAISISTLFLGIFSGKLIGKRGLVFALGLATLFVFLIVFSVNCLFYQDLALDSFNYFYLIPIIIGGLGGIIGVNVKK